MIYSLLIPTGLVLDEKGVCTISTNHMLFFFFFFDQLCLTTKVCHSKPTIALFSSLYFLSDQHICDFGKPLNNTGQKQIEDAWSSEPRKGSCHGGFVAL